MQKRTISSESTNVNRKRSAEENRLQNVSGRWRQRLWRRRKRRQQKKRATGTTDDPGHITCHDPAHLAENETTYNRRNGPKQPLTVRATVPTHDPADPAEDETEDNRRHVPQEPPTTRATLPVTTPPTLQKTKQPKTEEMDQSNH